jgi:hypothetical protein
MLQLDLDEASRVTNEDLGNGLLQVWMPGEMWGYGQELSAKCIRIIPRHIVRSTKHLIDVPEHQAVTDLVQNICEEGVDHWESDYSEELWLEQVDGNLWRLDGDVAHYKPIQALQITGWNAVGYSIPKDSGGFWGGATPQEVFDDPIHQAMDEIITAFDELPPWHQACLFGQSSYVTVEPGWRPLFAFNGPVEDPCVDDHTVFFRRTAGRFEYKYVTSRFT